LKLNDDVFSTPELTKPIGELQLGNYLMYNIRLPDDEVIDTYDDQLITVSRVGLASEAGRDFELYLRAIIGVPLVGEAIQGVPPERPQAIISNLVTYAWDLIPAACLFGECSSVQQ
jgi:hypothetical protein